MAYTIKKNLYIETKLLFLKRLTFEKAMTFEGHESQGCKPSPSWINQSSIYKYTNIFRPNIIKTEFIATVVTYPFEKVFYSNTCGDLFLVVY